MILMRRLVFNGGCKRPAARLRSVRYKGNIGRHPNNHSQLNSNELRARDTKNSFEKKQLNRLGQKNEEDPYLFIGFIGIFL